MKRTLTKLLKIFDDRKGYWGVLFGALLTLVVQYTIYRAGAHDRLREARIASIEKAYKIFAKSEGMRLVFEKVEFEAPDSAALKRAVHEHELRMQAPRDEYFSELLSVMKMSQLYFGDRTRSEIDSLLKDLAAAEEDWIEVVDDDFNKRANGIINTMVRELDAPYEPHKVLPERRHRKQ